MTGLPPEYFRGSLYGGIRNRLSVDIDDLPPTPEGFEAIAAAADGAMFEGFASAHESSELREAVAR